MFDQSEETLDDSLNIEYSNRLDSKGVIVKTVAYRLLFLIRFQGVEARPFH